MNSGPRWLISTIDAPASRHSSISDCALRSTGSGSVAGPALKFQARGMVGVVDGELPAVCNTEIRANTRPSHPLDAFRRNCPATPEEAVHVPARGLAHPILRDHRRNGV